ncbi:hypothetical protein F5Y14DRAFT_442552 [Nemania sp. NC0429]|nr:hypothetical protein F5Y14DRAFT_442552 [Nemania sp. NC0429]
MRSYKSGSNIPLYLLFSSNYNITSFTARDLDRVFRYSHAPATVITLLGSQEEIVEHECVTEEDWNALIREVSAVSEFNHYEFIITLSRSCLRLGGKMGTQALCYSAKNPRSPAGQNDGDEKHPQIRHVASLFENEESVGASGEREPRILPFSREVFSRVSEAFYMHRSISPAINRADVPLFSYDDYFLQDEPDAEKARVYTCRSTNAWGSDLAMTVTHFPHCRLSFGALLGCSEPHKKYVVQQLRLAIRQASHPLLLPGLFVEIERKRHHIIFESGVSRLESMIPTLDSGALISQHQPTNDSERHAKQRVYLDMLHLKNGLTTWSQQLNKMLDHARTLTDEYAEPWRRVSRQPAGESCRDSEMASNSALRDPKPDVVASFEDRPDNQSSTNSVGDFGIDQETMVTTNLKIIKRIESILEDYRDKIIECQTRFDGLAMATQLYQGETSMSLALTSSRDSRHMRTIALVTMVFLPGTFFATIFSMTFFNWQAGDGESAVSSSFWIYIAFSVASTAVVLLAYYYSISRRPRQGLGDSISP